MVIDVMCPIKEGSSISSTIIQTMQEMDFWSSLLDAKGESVPFLRTISKPYREVARCLKCLPNSLDKNKFTSDLILNLNQWKKDTKSMHFLMSHTGRDVGQLIELASKRYHENDEKMRDIHSALAKLTNQVSNDGMVFLKSDCICMMQHCNDSITDLRGGKIELLDFMNTPALKIEKELLSFQQITTSLMNSQLFLGVCKTVLMEEVEIHLIRDNATTHSYVPISMHIEESMKHVEHCCIIVQNECIARYQKLWEPFKIQSEITVEKVQTLFDHLNIDNEIQILETFNGKELHQKSKLALKSFCNRELYREKVESMIDVLEAFCIDQEKNTKLNQALHTYQTLDLNSGTEKDFWILSRNLEDIYSVANKIDDDYLHIITMIGRSKTLIDFFKKLIKEDLRNFLDAVEEYSETSISVSTIYSLIGVQRFLSPLLKIPPEGSVEEFFDLFVKQQKTSGVSNIDRKLEECNANVHGLIELYKSKANRGQQTIEKVQSIVKTGIFTFSLKDEMCSVEIRATIKTDLTRVKAIGTISDVKEQPDGNQKDQKYKYYSESELEDLRSRAHLMMHTKHKGDENMKTIISIEEKKDLLLRFISHIDKAMEIVQVHAKLHRCGHYRYTELNLSKKLNELDNVHDAAKLELKKWNETLDFIRMKHYVMNFIHPDHIPALYKFISTGGKEGVKDIQSILLYISPYSNLEIDLHNLISSEPQTFLEAMAELLDRATTDKLRQHSTLRFKVERSYTEKQNRVQEGVIYIAKLADQSNERGVQTMFSLYLANEEQLPAANQIVLCTRDTEWNEIHLLLQRCLGARKHYIKKKLFCIANADELSTDVQTSLAKAIKHLDEETDFMLAIIFRGDDKQAFLQYFPNNVHYVEKITDTETKDCLQKICPDVHVVTSSFPGQGKSKFIKQTVGNMSQRIATLTINSILNKDNIIRRLKSMDISNDTVLHIDVGIVDKIADMDLFLFQLLALRYVSHGRMSYYLQTSKVYIEIANTVNNLLVNDLEILRHLRRKHISWNDFRDYNINLEVSSPVQIVCHYLKQFQEKTIDLNEISFSDTDKLCVHALEQEVCRNILRDFSPKLTGQLSFTLVEIFIRVLAKQLQKMTVSAFFKPRWIKEMLGRQRHMPTVRSSMMEAMLEISREFACKSVSSYREAQAESQRQISLQIHTDQPESHNIVNAMDIVRWNDCNHIVVGFHKDNHTISILYKKIEKEPSHIKCIRTLIEEQNRCTEIPLEEKSQFELKDILIKFASTADVERKAVDSNLISYVLTPDNCLKFVLISLRIQAKIPVILMGETGCGKTSLIRHLAFLCEVEYRVFSIHAGITEQDILTFVTKCNEKAKSNYDKEVWLFFDEVNTSEQVGFIANIICRRRCCDILLAPNMIVIAACNPYRYRDKKYLLSDGLQDNRNTNLDAMSSLVYRVHPLPESLIDYVWDFGTLSETDEAEYIKRMLQSCLDHFRSTELLTLFEKLIIRSQTFVRKREKKEYSVSLRDVNRCKHLTIWFLKDYMLKKEDLKCFEKGDVIKAMVLSANICYYIRFRANDTRKSYLHEISAVMKTIGNGYTESGILDLVTHEQNDILNRMDIPPGIAKNASLRENVFVMLVCTLNRIPLFVVGKPGCSKSLALQLMRENLRGLDSKDNFFKKLPHLLYVSYQGSEQSTSAGIENVFKKAITLQKAHEEDKGKSQKPKNIYVPDEGVCALMVLDEVGLAEKSISNPLKVLHGLLESQELQSDVAFIGVSNWALDAAKMNRAIHLSRPEMDLTELYATGHSIYESIKGNTRQQDQPLYIRKLADAYAEYISLQKQDNFHGLRDYYSLIKYVSQNACSDMNESKKMEVIEKGILRNFSGIRKEFSNVSAVFQRHLNLRSIENIPVTEMIKANVEDRSSRHLMLITNGDSVMGIIQSLLNELEREYTILIGSNFPCDKNIDYGYRTLSKIILCMEQGDVLVMKDLEGIYGSLYDMLNQNYTNLGNKKQCRIALGQHNNPLCTVNEKFKCIVVIEEDQVALADPPFLNRFEKHMFFFEDRLSKSQRNTVDIMEKYVRDMGKIYTENQIVVDVAVSPFLENEILRTNIASSVLKSAVNSCCSESIMINECLELLIPVLLPEAVFNLPCSIFFKNNSLLGQDLMNSLINMPQHAGLKHFLAKYTPKLRIGVESHSIQAVDRVQCNLHVIFTYSNPLINIGDCLGNMAVHVETLSTVSSELDLEERMKYFWNNSSASFLIVRATTIADMAKIPLTRLRIETWRRKYLNNCDTPKHVVLIIYLERNNIPKHICSVDYTSLWNYVYMDTIQSPVQTLPMMMEMAISEVFSERKEVVEKMLKDILHWAFLRIHYLKKGSHMQRIEKAVRIISKESKLRRTLVQIILDYIEHKEESAINKKKWIKDVAINSSSLSSCYTLTSAVEHFLLEQIKVPLAMIIYKLEQIDTLQTMCSMSDKKMLDRWIFFFSKSDFHDITGLQKPSGPGCYVIIQSGMEYKIPFFKVFFDRVQELQYGIHPKETRNISIQLATLNESDYELNKVKQDYLHDFCTCMNFSMSPKVEDRMNFINWTILHFDNGSGDLMTCDLAEFVVRLHSCHWNHSLQISAVLELIQIAPIVGLIDVLPLMRRCSAESIVGTESDNLCGRQKAVAMLVKEICVYAIPNKTLQEKGDLTKWYQNANMILCLGDRTGLSITELDTLKFFVELVGILKPHRLSTKNLVSFGHCFVEPDSRIEEEKIYTQLISLLEELNLKVSLGHSAHIQSSVLNQAIAMYLNRCLSVNSNSTQRICDVLRHLQNAHETYEMTYFGSTIQFYLDSEMETERERTVFDKILRKTSEGETISPFMTEVKHMLNSSLGHSTAILLVDILQKIVYGQDTINVKTICDIQSNDNILLKMAGNASTFTKQIDDPWMLVTAVGFLKSFLIQIAESLRNSLVSCSKVVIGNLNSILSYKKGTCVKNRTLHVFFLRCLENQEGFCKVKYFCAKYKDIEVCGLFEKEDVQIENTFELDSRTIFGEAMYNSVANAFHSTARESEVEDLLLAKNEEKRGCLLAYMKSNIFLKHIYDSNIDETVRRKAKYTFDKAKELGIDETYTALIGILSLSKTPEIELLALKKSDGVINQLMMTLLHFVCVVYTHTAKDGFWFLCLKNPKCTYVRKKLQQDNLPEEAKTVKAITCKCSHRIKTTKAKCPVCLETTVTEDEDVSCSHAWPSDVFFRANENCSCIIFHLMQVLTTGCVVLSRTMQMVETNEIKEIYKNHNDIDEYLQEKLKLHWQILCLLLNTGSRDMHYLIKIILKKFQKDFFERVPISDSVGDWQTWESELSSKLHKLLNDKEAIIRQEVSIHNETMQMDTDSYWYQLTNKCDTPSAFNVPELFWEVSSPSIENMYAELCTSEENYPFLKLVIERHDELKLPKHIIALVEWHKFMVTTCSYYLRTVDCELPLKHIRTIPMNDSAKEEFNNKFCAFSETWESLQMFFGNIKTLKLPEIQMLTMDSKISDCLILGSDSIVFQVIENLARVQNSFLDAVLDLCVKGKCLPVTLFSKGDGAAAIPIISLIETTSDNLVNILQTCEDDQGSDFLEDMLCSFSERCTFPGKSGTFKYNFNKIEFELAQYLLLGKCYISLHQRVPRMQFIDDAFQNTVSLIMEVKNLIRQDTLPKIVIQTIKNTKTLPFKDILIISGSVLAHLRHTGGNPDQQYLEYIKESKGILLPMSDFEFFNKTGEKICLRHAVSMYRLMEEINGEQTLKNLPPAFKTKLPVTAEKLIDSVAQQDIQILNDMLVAVKTFVYRRHANDENIQQSNKDIELSSYLKEPSLWPEEYQNDDKHTHNFFDSKLKDFLHPNLMVHHLCTFAEYLSGIIVKNPFREKKTESSANDQPQSSELHRKPRVKKAKF